MIKRLLYKVLGMEPKEPNYLLLFHMKGFTEETDVGRLQREKKEYTAYIQQRTT